MRDNHHSKESQLCRSDDSLCPQSGRGRPTRTNKNTPPRGTAATITGRSSKATRARINGREWIFQRDASTNPQTWNKYAYVSGDPVNKRDPSGLQEQPPFCDVYPDDPQCVPFWTCPDGAIILQDGLHPRCAKPVQAADPWDKRSVDTKLTQTRELMFRMTPGLSDDCMGLLSKLNSTEGLNDRNGNPAPAVNKQALQGAFKTMTFHNLNTHELPLLSYLWHVTESEMYETARRQDRNTFLLADLGSGFAVDSSRGNCVLH